MHTTGIDLSLTGTGIAHHQTNDNTLTPIRTLTITSAGTKKDTLKDRTTRLRKLRNAIIDHIPTHTDLVAIEGPAYASNTGSMWDRAGLWWLVVNTLDQQGIPVITIPPATLKKFATDNGRADKGEVIAAMRHLWRDHAAHVADDNQADALALATMAAVHIDYRELDCTLLERHRLAVGALSWPAIRGRPH